MGSVSELSGKIDTTAVRPAVDLRSGYTKFATGDVIFAKITPCMENGKMAIIPDLPFGMGAGSTEFHVLEPQEVTAEFLFYWLSQQWFRDVAEANMTGTAGQKRVPTGFLRAAAIPVPPLDTQRRIVARIDELFSELDDGEAALARARADLETYRKSLLKAAVTGELTADWRVANPPSETGEQLLQRILADRKARWEADPKNKGKRYKEPMQPTGKLPELPNGWAWCTVDQLITGLRNGVSDKPNNQPPGTPIFKISAVRELEVRTSEIRWLPENVAVGEATVAPGDLIFTRYNGSPELVGVCGRYRGEIPVAYPDKLMRAQPVSRDAGLVDFIELAANCGATRAYIQSYTKTSAGQHGVSGETVKSAPIPLPSLAEAVEIARRFRESLDARADASTSIDQLATASSDLRQSILAAAFRGELVQ